MTTSYSGLAWSAGMMGMRWSFDLAVGLCGHPTTAAIHVLVGQGFAAVDARRAAPRVRSAAVWSMRRGRFLRAGGRFKSRKVSYANMRQCELHVNILIDGVYDLILYSVTALSARHG